MKDITVGIIAIAVGSLFCFRGWLAMRFIIPIWGAFSGFMLGAGAVQGWTGDGFLSTGVSWIVGFVLALVFGAFAYLYYEFAVVLAMAAIGFAIGSGILAALGVNWSWVLVTAGIVVGVALAWVSIISDVPMGLLIVVSVLAGATTIVAGIMLLVGTFDVADLDQGVTAAHATDNPWWYVVFGALAVAGLVSQLAFRERVDASLRAAWVQAGGREFRSS